MDQPPGTAVVDPSVVSLHVELPAHMGADNNSSTDHGSKGPFSKFPHDAFGGSGPTEKDACTYLTTTLKVSQPTIQEIDEVKQKMAALHKGITDYGATLYKSKFGELAENRNMMFGTDNLQKVCSFVQMKDSFRKYPSYRKCELVFGIIYTWPESPEGKKWFDEQVRIVKEKYKLHYPDVPACFVSKVLKDRSWPNVKTNFQYKTGSKDKGSFGLTCKKDRQHAMGVAKMGRDFQPQNISGWEYLIEQCPLARSMHDTIHGIPATTTSASLTNSQLSLFGRQDHQVNGTALRDTTNTSSRDLKAVPAANVSVGSSRDFSRRFPVQVQENFPDCSVALGDRIARVEPPNSVVMASTTATEVSSLKGSQAEVI